jgi:pyruvate dehydrogenase E2 component (dihydrolipoamide acetyltransferase)
MPIEILMPSTGGDMTEGNIARWAVKPGDAVRKDAVLLEIETDKALVEVPAPGDGVLATILSPDGAERVKAGAVIGLIAVAGEDPGALRVAEPAKAAAAGGAPRADVVTAAVRAQETAPASRVAASPLARRIASMRQIDLATVPGSGPNGRIVKVDVDKAAARAPTPAAAPAAAPTAATSAKPSAGSGERAAGSSVPHTAMRRAIAQRLTQSKQSIPHFYLTIDCDVGALVALRAALEAQAGFKPSINDFLVRAVALALKEVPGINASWGDDAVQRHAVVDVSVAVATPGGLVTPIVCDADAKSLRTISAEIRALVERARVGPLKAHEIQGGSFTISNLGMAGIREFSAIVNPPQSCILAVGASEQRAVVRDGALAIATLMTCTLSADHRLVDGMLGAEFLAVLRRLVEAPLSLLA